MTHSQCEHKTVSPWSTGKVAWRTHCCRPSIIARLIPKEFALVLPLPPRPAQTHEGNLCLPLVECDIKGPICIQKQEAAAHKDVRRSVCKHCSGDRQSCVASIAHQTLVCSRGIIYSALYVWRHCRYIDELFRIWPKIHLYNITRGGSVLC